MAKDKEKKEEKPEKVKGPTIEERLAAVEESIRKLKVYGYDV